MTRRWGKKPKRSWKDGPPAGYLGLPDIPQAESKPILETMLQVVGFLRHHGIKGDVVGKWVWIKPDHVTEEQEPLVIEAGFRFSTYRGEWYHNCGHRTRRGRCIPRVKYGAEPITGHTEERLTPVRQLLQQGGVR